MGLLRVQAQRMMAAPFISAGLESLRDPAPRAEAVAPAVRKLAARYPWIPDDPERVVRMQAVAGVAGGLLLASGRMRRLACLALAAQVVPAVLLEHHFWAEKDAVRRRNERQHLVKDLSLLGALTLVATEPRKRRAKRHRAERRESAPEQGVRSAKRAARRAARQAAHAERVAEHRASHAARTAARRAEATGRKAKAKARAKAKAKAG
ncbi:MAG: DoxX family membrane protein [Streptosporangiales bacterium]|nr:DoxX family membrane protein [Streptosporangiales bacterium]